MFYRETTEGIEMTTLPSHGSGRWTGSSMTPPVLCSSRASVSESSGSGRRVILTPADSMEFVNKIVEEHRKSVRERKSKFCLNSVKKLYFHHDDHGSG